MLRCALVLVFIVMNFCGSAQVLISFEFTSDDDNKPTRENDSCKCYVATGDTAHLVCIYDETSYYKLYTRRGKKLIAEGAFINEGDKFFQDGKWVARFESGRVKRTGYYKHGNPVGTWEEYYSTGKLRAVRNYTLFDDDGRMSSCLSGTSQEFYQNGNLKSSGLYLAVLTVVNDTVVVVDPITSQEIRTVRQHRQAKAEKMTPWDNYLENGELERPEENKDKDE